VETQAEEVFKKAKENNIGIIVMKPLAGGAITNAKVAIKYILNNENISVVIPGMESVDQVKENNKIKEGQYTDLEIKNIKEVKQLLDNDFCRRCGYCLPCTKGINIPFVFLCEGYVTRYNLGEWGLSRYQTLPAKASDCISCKVCESRCPYKLKISEKMKKVAKIMENKDEK
jgi:predicted aldo/keto reductase-like oxidoreductase